MAQSTLSAVQGSGRGTNFGQAIAGIGDVNLDGYDDFVVGIPEYDKGGVNRGAIRVISGKTGAELYTRAGAAAGDEHGYSVAAHADKDGDGIPDFLVGAPNASNGGVQGGRAFICSGVDGSSLVTFNGATSGDRLGWSVATGGSPFLGTRRVVIGAPYEDHGQNAVGSVYLYTEVGALLHEFTGSQANEHFGWSVSGARDCDGDFTPDLVVGSPHYDTGATDAGRMIVYSGSSPYSAIQAANGSGANYELGYSVSLISDINSDGNADIVAGAPGFSSDTGAAYLYLGTSGVIAQIKVGNSAGDRFGTAVLAITDKNGDGKSDYLAGAPWDITGGVNGSVVLYSGANGAVLATFNGSASLGSGAHYGAALGQADLDNDNKSDILIGAPGATVGGILDAGFVSSFNGATLGLGFGFSGAVDGNRLGSSAAGIGDINNDNIPDYVAGAPNEDYNINIFGNTVWFDNAGSVRCYSGSNNSVLWTSRGSGAGDNYGFSVARIADINNDGVDDLAVGATQDDTAAGLGYVNILSGASGALLWHVTGSGSDSRFGFSAADAGDINSDGVHDIAIAVPNYNSSLGRISIVSGATGAQIITKSGTVAGEAFGNSIACVGDYTGDGKPELIIGAPLNSSAAGRVYGWNPAFNFTFFTDTGVAGDFLGWRVAALGDVTDDGKIDFIATAPFATSNGHSQAGSVRAYASGPPVTPLWTLNGVSTADQTGLYFTNIGDITGDGRDDFAAAGSQQFNATTAGPGRVLVGDGYLGSKLYQIEGDSSFDMFGWGLGAAGDINNDGTPDLIAGSAFSDPGCDESGKFKIISMWPRGVTRYGTSTPGCAGPQKLKMAGAASLGDWFYFGCDNVEPGSLGVALITDSQDIAGNDIFNIGVTLYVDFIFATEVFALDTYGTPTGHSVSGALVPNNALLVGNDYYLQQLNYWTTCAVGPMNLSGTDALKIVIQS